MASSDAESVLVSRRRWLQRVALAAPVVGVGDAAVIEPRWLKVATFQRGRGEVRQRCVQITDIHFKGDSAYLQKVVCVNAGIGTFYFDVRFNCRPEITVFDLCW